MEDNKIKKLSMLLKGKEHISVSIDTDNWHAVKGESYNNVKAYVSRNKLIIEEAGKQVTLTEDSIIKFEGVSAKIRAKDEDNREIYISILAR